jgi:ribonucleoside-diphosphate reductase beta chain
VTGTTDLGTNGGTPSLMTPQQLYQLWERQQWSAHAIDLSADRADWLRLDEDELERISWNLRLFFLGEERVTTELSALVMSAESQGELAYLCTQQVDEARHTQHFHRFYEEVMQLDGTFEQRLERAREGVNDSFVTLFDENLTEVARRLAADPSDVEAKVDFVCTYHMVIEGTLALSGQAVITDYFEQRGIFPGFVEGFRNVTQDEHRHIAYGVWYLQQKARDPELRRRIRNTVLKQLRTTTDILVPPGVEDPYSIELLDQTIEQAKSMAFNAVRRRLKIIGIKLPAATWKPAPAQAQAK